MVGGIHLSVCTLNDLAKKVKKVTQKSWDFVAAVWRYEGQWYFSETNRDIESDSGDGYKGKLLIFGKAWMCTKENNIKAFIIGKQSTCTTENHKAILEALSRHTKLTTVEQERYLKEEYPDEP